MKIPSAFRTSVSIILLISMAGCATMFHGSSQTVTMRSNHDDTKFYVNEGYVGKGSAVAVFQKRQNYSIRASREGFADITIPATKSFDATCLLGILIDWGIISILCVDGLGTGAWQQFDQTVYVIDPEVKK